MSIGCRVKNFWRLKNFSLLQPINAFEKFVDKYNVGLTLYINLLIFLYKYKRRSKHYIRDATIF